MARPGIPTPSFNRNNQVGKALSDISSSIPRNITVTNKGKVSGFGDQLVIDPNNAKEIKSQELHSCQYRTSSGTIPPYSVLEIYGYNKTLEVYYVRRPTGDNKNNLIFTNVVNEIEYNEAFPTIGMRINWFKSGIPVKFLLSAGIPTPGVDEVGTVANQWYVKKGNYGLIVLGVDSTDDGNGRGLVWVRPFNAGPYLSYFSIRLWPKTGMISDLEECPDPTEYEIDVDPFYQYWYEQSERIYTTKLSLYSDPRTYVANNVLSQNDLYFGMVPNNGSSSGMPTTSVRSGSAQELRKEDDGYYGSSDVRSQMDISVGSEAVDPLGIDNFNIRLPEKDSIYFRGKQTKVFKSLGPAVLEDGTYKTYRPDLIRRPRAIIKRDGNTIYDTITENTDPEATISTNLLVVGTIFKSRGVITAPGYDHDIHTSSFAKGEAITSDFFFNLGSIAPNEKLFFQFKMLKESSIYRFHDVVPSSAVGTIETGKNYNLNLVAQLWDCRNIADDNKGILVTTVDVNESLSTDGDVLVSMEFTVPEDYSP